MQVGSYLKQIIVGHNEGHKLKVLFEDKAFTAGLINIRK